MAEAQSQQPQTSQRPQTATPPGDYELLTLPPGSPLPDGALPTLKSAFQQSGVTPEAAQSLLDWHHFIGRAVQASGPSPEEETRQIIAEARQERQLLERRRELTVKRLSPTRLSAAEDAELSHIYQRLADLRPPGSPPKYDASRGW
jgi:hypothetical protein